MRRWLSVVVVDMPSRSLVGPHRRPVVLYKCKYRAGPARVSADDPAGRSRRLRRDDDFWQLSSFKRLTVNAICIASSCPVHEPPTSTTARPTRVMKPAEPTSFALVVSSTSGCRPASWDNRHPPCTSSAQFLTNDFPEFRCIILDSVQPSRCLLPISLARNVIRSVVSVRFRSICWTSWPLTLIFCVHMGHDHSSPGLKVKVTGQG